MSSLEFIENNQAFINASKLQYFEAHNFPIIDIDNSDDFFLAEKLFSKNNDW